MCLPRGSACLIVSLKWCSFFSLPIKKEFRWTKNIPLFFLNGPQFFNASVKLCVAVKFWVSEIYANSSSLLPVGSAWTLTTQQELTINYGSRTSVQCSYSFHLCCEMILRQQKFSRWEVMWFLLGNILCRNCFKVLILNIKNTDSRRVPCWEAKPVYQLRQIRSLT